MNKTLNKIMLGLASLFLTHAALADNSGKVYISGDFGSTSYNNANITVSGTRNTFPNPGAIILAVGYHISPAVAVEMGYTKFGNSILIHTSGDITLEAKSVTGSLVGTHAVNSQFNIFGRLGIASNSATVTLPSGLVYADGTRTSSASQSSMLYGIGVGFTLSDAATLRAQYINYGNFESASNPLSASTVSLGVTYDF